MCNGLATFSRHSKQLYISLIQAMLCAGLQFGCWGFVWPALSLLSDCSCGMGQHCLLLHLCHILSHHQCTLVDMNSKWLSHLHICICCFHSLSKLLTSSAFRVLSEWTCVASHAPSAIHVSMHDRMAALRSLHANMEHIIHFTVHISAVFEMVT
jgi:hypothetical protein